MARENALNNFANILLQEASTQKQEVLTQLKQDWETRLSQADKRLQRQLKQEVKDGQAALEHEMRLSLTRRETELHRALLQNRQKAFEQVFAAVTENVRAFTQGPDYEAFLTREFQAAAPAFQEGGRVVCTVMAQDMPLAEKLFRLPGLELTPARLDIIGGFTLESDQLRRFADCTLANRIEAQKQAFYGQSGLILD